MLRDAKAEENERKRQAEHILMLPRIKTNHRLDIALETLEDAFNSGEVTVLENLLPYILSYSEVLLPPAPP